MVSAQTNAAFAEALRPLTAWSKIALHDYNSDQRHLKQLYDAGKIQSFFVQFAENIESIATLDIDKLEEKFMKMKKNFDGIYYTTLTAILFHVYTNNIPRAH